MNVIIFEDDSQFAEYIKGIVSGAGVDFSISLITADFASLCRHIELLEQPTIFILDIMFSNRTDGFKMADMTYIEIDQFIQYLIIRRN